MLKYQLHGTYCSRDCQYAAVSIIVLYAFEFLDAAAAAAR
jgi:hypothetical protein